MNKTFTVRGLALALELKPITVYMMIDNGDLDTVSVKVK